MTRAGEFDAATEAAIGSLAVPIGLAIDDSSARSVNLLQKDATTEKSKRSRMIAIGAPLAAAIPLVALGFMYVGAHGTGFRPAVPARRRPGRDRRPAAAAGPEYRRRASSATRPSAPPPSRACSVAGLPGMRVFRDLSRVLPANVWLTKLSVTQPQAGNLADGTTTPVAAVVPARWPHRPRVIDRRLHVLAARRRPPAGPARDASRHSRPSR